MWKIIIGVIDILLGFLFIQRGYERDDVFYFGMAALLLVVGLGQLIIASGERK